MSYRIHSRAGRWRLIVRFVCLMLLVAATHSSVLAANRIFKGTIEVSVKQSLGWSNLVSTPFTWISNGGELWRIDFEEIVGPGSRRISATLLPSPGNGIISIRYPNIPEGPRSAPVTNAFVEIVPVDWVPAASQAGAVAVWIGFNLKQIKDTYSPSGDCPPFWSLDPRFFLQKTFTHRVEIDLEGKVARFLNRGLEPVLDTSGSVKTNGAGPVYRASRPPINNGFPEAQLTILDGTVEQPKSYQLLYTVPYADGQSFRLEPYYRFNVSVAEERILPEDMGVFAVAWTNTSAKIIDPRVHDSKGGALVYSISSNSFDPSIGAARRAAEEEARFMMGVRKPPARRFSIAALIALAAVIITPFILWRIIRRP